MKNYIIYFAIGLSIMFSGCVTEKIQTITPAQSTTNNVMQSSFNTKRYIWEFWTVSTNKCNETIK